ncbi:hypothetical protein A4H97_10630 [Niastella yeongjuensis]|uniref:6-bladed beta-propeller n=1 Tax=Niastella yeongjuensis TaxID=354355 RepID=A0A1V9EF92_9BACT|nr:hypothetical protein A4H97_10630 [Niastella yeongjuensis]
MILYCQVISSIAQSQLQKIYLHPKASGSEKQSKFVDSIRFIPLEIKDDIQFRTYAGVEATDNYFLLKDYSGKTIALYSKKGRFIKKISYKKLGDFYPQYDEFNNQIFFFGSNKNYKLTSRDKIKIKLAWSNPRNKKYFSKYIIDLNDASPVIKKVIPQQNDILYANQYGDDLYAMGRISTSELYKDSLDYEFKIYKGTQLVKGYFPYNRINEPRFIYKEEGVSFIKTDTPDIHIVSRPFCDTIFKLVNDSLLPGYQLVLPLENSLPAWYFTRPFKNKTERDNFERNNSWMLHQVYSFYETPRFIYFGVGYLYNYETYIYQKQTNTSFKTKNIKSDSSQYNLSLLADYGISHKADKFYKAQNAGDLLTFFEKNKNVPVPPDLDSFIKSHPPATTPVIIEFKLKN